jgi:hypothetical protein
MHYNQGIALWAYANFAGHIIPLALLVVTTVLGGVVGGGKKKDGAAKKFDGEGTTTPTSAPEKDSSVRARASKRS